jgi:hypothetical protein
MIIKTRVSGATRRLQDQNTELVAALTEQRTKAAASAAVEAELRDQLVAIHADTGQTERKLRSRLDATRGNLAAADDRIAEVESKVLERKKDSARLGGQISALQAQLAAANAQEAALKARLRKTEMDLADKSEEVEALQRRSKRAIAEAAAFRVQARESGEAAKLAAARQQAADAAKMRSDSKLSSLRVELQIARDGAAKLDKMKEMLVEAKKQASEATEQVVVERATAAAAKQEAAQARAELASAAKTVSVAKAKARTSMAAIKSLNRASLAAGQGDLLAMLGPGTRRRLTKCGLAPMGEAAAAAAAASADSGGGERGTRESFSIGKFLQAEADDDSASAILDMDDLEEDDDLDDTELVGISEEDDDAAAACADEGVVGAGYDSERVDLARQRLESAVEARKVAEARVAAVQAEAEAKAAKVLALEAELTSAQASAELAEAEAVEAREELGKSQCARKELVKDLIDARGNLRVIARVRPLGVGAAAAASERDAAVTLVGDDRLVVAGDAASTASSGSQTPGRSGSVSSAADRAFTFNKALGPASTQEDVFTEVRPTVEGVLDGTSATIFAYGQTGAGKTHTMTGSQEFPGVTPRSLQLLLDGVRTRRAELGGSAACVLEVGMLEIYCEKLRDLLVAAEDADDDDAETSADGESTNAGHKAGRAKSRGRVAKAGASASLSVHQARDGSTYVEGMVFKRVEAMEEAEAVMSEGLARRSVASTLMNADSSRSHLVTMVRYTETSGRSAAGGDSEAGAEAEAESAGFGTTTSASLFLIDLAGSERLKKSDAQGARRSEAQAINKSLSSLGDVLSSLQNKSTHVPFRNSKLTHLLMSALSPGGGCRATMIVQVSPAAYNAQESCCSLAFGQRAASVQLGKASRKVTASSTGGSSSAGATGASRAKALEERLAKTEAKLRAEKTAHAQALDEMAALQRHARSLKAMAARGGSNARRRPATAAGRRAQTLALSAVEASRESVESVMEAASEWLATAPAAATGIAGTGDLGMAADADAGSEPAESTATPYCPPAGGCLDVSVRASQAMTAQTALAVTPMRRAPAASSSTRTPSRRTGAGAGAGAGVASASRASATRPRTALSVATRQQRARTPSAKTPRSKTPGARSENALPPRSASKATGEAAASSKKRFARVTSRVNSWRGSKSAAAPGPDAKLPPSTPVRA